MFHPSVSAGLCLVVVFIIWNHVGISSHSFSRLNPKSSSEKNESVKIKDDRFSPLVWVCLFLTPRFVSGECSLLERKQKVRARVSCSWIQTRTRTRTGGCRCPTQASPDSALGFLQMFVRPDVTAQDTCGVSESEPRIDSPVQVTRSSPLS